MTEWSKRHAQVPWHCPTDIGGESCSSFLGFSGILWGFLVISGVMLHCSLLLWRNGL
jgi:hypothetical protein